MLDVERRGSIRKRAGGTELAERTLGEDPAGAPHIAPHLPDQRLRAWKTTFVAQTTVQEHDHAAREERGGDIEQMDFADQRARAERRADAEVHHPTVPASAGHQAHRVAPAGRQRAGGEAHVRRRKPEPPTAASTRYHGAVQRGRTAEQPLRVGEPGGGGGGGGRPSPAGTPSRRPRPAPGTTVPYSAGGRPSSRFASASRPPAINRRIRELAAALIVGESFTFGRDRHGNMATLRSLAPELGMRVMAVRDVRSGGAPISSSRIRRVIAGGRLADAKRLLGRPPALYGTVVPGAGRGRRLGFPTANVRLTASTLPPRGGYAVSLVTGARGYRGVMNLGVRPTFGAGPLVCEVHLLDVTASLLARRVVVFLHRRLRNERCFPSPQALIRQVRRDVRRARRVLAKSSLR